MTKISFIYARFFENTASKRTTEGRLLRHLQRLRAAKQGDTEPFGTDSLEEVLAWEETQEKVPISRADEKRIHQRVEKLFERREAASGLGHLRHDDKHALECLRDGVRLKPIVSEAQADEIASELHDEMPWMAPATTQLWHAMRRSARRGEPGFRLPPLLLNGPPGIGKSVWARRLSTVLGAPLRIVDASGEQASFGVVGSQRGWGTAFPGKPLQTIMQHLIGNPVIVVDEIEKAGAIMSNRGMRCSITEGLLPLLERATAKEWECPYYQVRFDMSWISWVLTANSIISLPEPFLSRVAVITLDAPRTQHLIDFVRRQGACRGLTPPAIEGIVMAIERTADIGGRPSLRTIGRMLDHGEVLQWLPAIH